MLDDEHIAGFCAVSVISVMDTTAGLCGIIILDMTAGHCGIILLNTTAGHCGITVMDMTAGALTMNRDYGRPGLNQSS